MKKYALIGILSVLALFLIFIVFYLLWKFRADSLSFPQLVKEHNTTLITPKLENSWQQEFASLPNRDFTPAAEQFTLHFEADTSDLKEKSKYFQLIINKYDIYSMFCLKQTLNSFNVKYFLLKTAQSSEIFLDTDNKKLIQDIINELKKYKIHTEIKEIWL